MTRPLLDKLHDIEHCLILDKQPLHAQTIREAINELQRLAASPPSADIVPFRPRRDG